MAAVARHREARNWSAPAACDIFPIEQCFIRGFDMTDGCAAREPYALRVIGDSMAPEFWDGCIVIVEPGAHARDGSFVVIDYQGDTLFRQLRIDGQRRVLKPLNEQYPSVEIDGEYSIRGIVVQRAGRRRSEHKHYD